MPRYYFDTNDGERKVHDESGVDLASVDDIEATTRDLLLDLGHAKLLDGKDRRFTAVVRDDQGATVYHGSMVLRIDWSPT